MPTRRALVVVERNGIAYRRMWYIFAAGFLEPVLSLLAIGVGVGALVGTLPGPGGRPVPYEEFMAPGVMAAAAMNAAILDTTYNFFVRFKYYGVYHTMLATPIGVRDLAWGEVLWGLGRGAVYATAFLATMAGFGLVSSWWALLAVPASLLIGLAFAGVGLAATTFLRSFTDFDFVALAQIPMVLFSGTYFPLSRYPDAVEWFVSLTPLYQGIALTRALTLGEVGWGLLWHVAYLAAMGLAGVRVASNRLRPLLNP